MAFRVLQYAATIPAGTPQATPHNVSFPLDNWILEALELEVPYGPSGLMGFAVFNNNVQWIPQPTGAWLVWDNVTKTWPFSDQPNASGWAVKGYNTGRFDHTITVRFHVNPVTVTPAIIEAPSITIVTSGEPETLVVTL